MLDLYEEYVHGQTDRRGFLDRAAKFAVGGTTAAALLDSLQPDYALAQQVPEDDDRIETEFVAYPSPEGYEKTNAYLVRPAELEGKLPGVLVVHENRGLTPYVADVARRVANAGYIVLAPDVLASLGGYPGTDDEGRILQRQLDGEKKMQDFVAAARFLHAHPGCDGKVGVVGFCYGGEVSNTLAARIPEINRAVVPFYGRPAALTEVPKSKGSLLIHYGEKDERINQGWPCSARREGRERVAIASATRMKLHRTRFTP